MKNGILAKRVLKPKFPDNSLSLFRPLPVVLLALFLAACGGKNSPAGEGGQSPVQDRKDLSVALSLEPEEGFDPTVSWGNHEIFVFQSTLLKYGLDMNLTGELAESYSVDSTGKVYTFVLRKDVTFSDGEPFTAEDVVFTLKKAAQTSTFIDYTAMEDVRADGDYQVIITLNKVESTFPNSIARQGIVPAHAYNEDTYPREPTGTGPYVLKQWDRGQQVITQRNPHYFRNTPYFEKITFVFLSEDAALAAAKAGTVDIAMTTPVLATAQIPGMRLEAYKASDARGIGFPVLKRGAVTRTDGAVVGNDVTSDAAIRRALNYAVDRQALVDHVLNGFGQRQYTESDNLAWGNPEALIADNNLEEAGKILDAAGWIDVDGDGIREKNGLKAEFTVLYPSVDGTRQAIAVVFADMAKPLGIKVHVEGLSWDQLFRRWYEDASVLGTGQLSPMTGYRLYSSRYAGIGYDNTSYYSNPMVDTYFDQAMDAAADTTYSFWKKAQWDGAFGTSVKGDAVFVWLLSVDHLYYVNENLFIGEQRLHGHGTQWQIVHSIEDWKWTE
ncbi:MAG: ABC transporter substrate-binding protein [Treponema sp.]|jgi:peptide/nickel transport system substrate-binding protein|nr:ABC transporter substrate-binding protein [Treponema sp.]